MLNLPLRLQRSFSLRGHVATSRPVARPLMQRVPLPGRAPAQQVPPRAPSCRRTSSRPPSYAPGREAHEVPRRWPPAARRCRRIPARASP